MRVFLDSQGYSNEATVIVSSIDIIASLHGARLATARQTTLDEFFAP